MDGFTSAKVISPVEDEEAEDIFSEEGRSELPFLARYVLTEGDEDDLSKMLVLTERPGKIKVAFAVVRFSF